MDATATLWVDDSPAPAASEPPSGCPRSRSAEKILPLGKLPARLSADRKAGCTIVHTHGTFDLLHIGVVRHLERARPRGALLVVTITPDADLLRTGAKPLFNQDMRAEALAALECVDYVVVARGMAAAEAIETVMPDIYAFWDEGKPGESSKARQRDEAAVTAVGGQFVQTCSADATVRLNHHPSPLVSREAGEFLGSLRARYTRNDVAAALDKIRTTSVLYIGETIIDEYQYCESLGKSGKEPVLAVRYVSDEKFAGGVLATANQSAAFCDQVGLVTLLGENESHEDFVRAKLNPKIDSSFLYMAAARTIVKRRMVETYPFQKLFEVYFMDPEIPEAANRALYSKLQAMLPHYEAVVVTDYGHGMLTPEIVELLCASDCFLAVNTQTNAANQGFNSPSKYRRADFLCLSEKELRLEVRHRTKDLQMIMAETAERMACAQMMVTRGRSGSLCYHVRDGFVTVPSFTARIVDRIGAGDALLAVASLCAAKDVPMELTGFIGNAVGARAVETVGNRSVVTPDDLSQQINELLSYDHWISTQ